MHLLARIALRPALRSAPQSTRTFTTLSPLRPTLTSTPRTGALLRPSFSPLPQQTATESATADLVPKTAISAHPAFADTQIRCGPRNTMVRATRLVQKRRHGFLKRTRSRTGRMIISRRSIKGRKTLGQ